MTQLQLESAVVRATGEPLGRVRHLGFSMASAGQEDLEPEDLVLAVVCPFCRRTVAYPGRTPGGELPLAECDDCDVFFEITADEIIAAPRRA